MSSSSKQWMQRHVKDPFVRQAKRDGYPCRAVYKLLEIDDLEHILKPGMTVVDLGAAPGGWSMIAAQRVGGKGRVIALDLLPLKVEARVDFLQGDFTEQACLDQLTTMLGDRKIDVLLSDMAPNLSGQKTIDQPRSIFLVELAQDFALQFLRPGGTFLTKLFQGAGSEEVLKQLKSEYKKVKIKKPKASRPRSREVYVLGLDFIGYNGKKHQR